MEDERYQETINIELTCYPALDETEAEDNTATISVGLPQGVYLAEHATSVPKFGVRGTVSLEQLHELRRAVTRAIRILEDGAGTDEAAVLFELLFDIEETGS